MYVGIVNPPRPLPIFHPIPLAESLGLLFKFADPLPPREARASIVSMLCHSRSQWNNLTIPATGSPRRFSPSTMTGPDRPLSIAADRCATRNVWQVRVGLTRLTHGHSNGGYLV